MPGLGGISAIRSLDRISRGHAGQAAADRAVPADPRLYLATGHEGLGITTSLATGKLVADQIMQRATGDSGRALSARPQA